MKLPAILLSVLSLASVVPSLSFADSSGETAMDSKKCDCTKIAGLWFHVDEETGTTTFVQIPKSCRGVKIGQSPSHPEEDSGLAGDRILCEGGKYRIQYRFPEGYVDDEGTRAVYPLPPEAAAQMRGDVRIEGDSVRFGFDPLDRLCEASNGKPCESASFTRVPL